MIINTNSKDELNTQLQENLTDLNNLRNLYNKKLQIFSTCLQNINDEIQQNTKKEEIDFFMSLLSKLKNNLDFIRKQKSLAKKSTTLLQSIQEESNNTKSEIFASKIEEFNKLFKDCKTNFYTNSINDENLILDYINSTILTAKQNLNNTENLNNDITETSVEIKPETEISSETETKLKNKIKNKIKNKTKKEPKNKNGLKTKDETKTPNELKAENETSSLNNPKAKHEASSLNDPKAKNETSTLNETKAKHETKSENKPKVKNETKTKSKSKSKLETEVSSTTPPQSYIIIDETKDNTTLLISEVQNRVILPYKISELKKTLKRNTNYKNIQELVNDKYIFPLTNFKNSSTSRFKEGFYLMRKKEKASLFDSLDLAFEVTFNNSLNPAIIAACKNLDELDTYLDCLSANELDKFNCFEIKYEMLPTKAN